MNRKFLIMAALIQCLWGITPTASRVVLNYMPVELYAATRYLASGCIFLGVSFAMRGSFYLKKGMVAKLAVIGLLTYALNSLGTLYGLKIGGVLNFSLASSMNAVITALVALVFLKERVHRCFIAAACLSMGGGLFLFWGKLSVSNFSIAAGSLVLIWSAYVLEALGLVFSRSYKNVLPLTEYIGVMQLCAGSFMLGLTATNTGWPIGALTMPWQGWMALSFVCLVSCCLCYFVQYWLLNHMDGHRLAFFDCFHTIVSAVLGVAVFSEPYNAKMACGGALLLAAVFLIVQQQTAQVVVSDEKAAYKTAS